MVSFSVAARWMSGLPGRVSSSGFRVVDQRYTGETLYGPSSNRSGGFVGLFLYRLFLDRFALDERTAGAGFVERLRMVEQRAAGKPLCGAPGNAGNGFVDRRVVSGRSHHFAGDVVGFLLVLVAGIGDVQLGLNAVGGHPALQGRIAKGLTERRRRMHGRTVPGSALGRARSAPALGRRRSLG